LKNISGLWLLQECRKAWSRGEEIPWSVITDEAESAPAFRSILDPDAPEFLNPPDMPEAIAGHLRRRGMEEPSSRGAMARAVLESLALAYRKTLEEIRELAEFEPSRIHLVGGGSRNELLCRFTADATGLPVIAGPAEATAAGNILVQAIGTGVLSSLEQAREVSARSSDVREYEPRPSQGWEDAYGKFEEAR
jgi:rhamnulokinase